jgi:deoxyadenosine/deoxycytidine kinase
LQSEERRRENPSLITIYDRHFLDDYVFAELHSVKENISMYNSLTYQGVYKELLDKMSR